MISGDDHVEAVVSMVEYLAERERQRADRVAGLAVRHEKLVAVGSESHRDLHERMAVLNRGLEERHRAAERIHTAHADRLRDWAARGLSTRPAFMASIAAMAGGPTALTLVGSGQDEAFAAASDTVAQAAQDLELLLSEGPMHEAVRRREPVLVRADDVGPRWPLYGPALAELGVRSVTAVPLGSRWLCLGALAVFEYQPDATVDVTELGVLAEALTHSVLLAPDETGDFPYLRIFEEGSGRQELHQAIGMISTRRGCSADDALALLQARAYAEAQTVDAVARRVIEREITLD